MSLPRAGHYIDIRAHRIVEVRELSRRFVKYLDEADALMLLDDSAVGAYRWDTQDDLQKVDVDTRSELREEIIGHITADSENIDPISFEDGYCFLVSLWKGSGGTKILILQYFH